MLDYKPNIVLSNKEFNLVGSRPIRPDGADEVTGRARYEAHHSVRAVVTSERVLEAFWSKEGKE